jgi:hypothetical protein
MNYKMRDGFHWQDGWYFKRMGDGSVEATKTVTDHVDSPLMLKFSIAPEQWTSIAFAVSVLGAAGNRWNTVYDFHRR